MPHPPATKVPGFFARSMAFSELITLRVPWPIARTLSPPTHEVRKLGKHQWTTIPSSSDEPDCMVELCIDRRGIRAQQKFTSIAQLSVQPRQWCPHLRDKMRKPGVRSLETLCPVLAKIQSASVLSKVSWQVIARRTKDEFHRKIKKGAISPSTETSHQTAIKSWHVGRNRVPPLKLA